jgi:hypothetical protein
MRRRDQALTDPVEALRDHPEAGRCASLAATVGYSVADLCRRWRVGPDKIHGFLRRGELVGVNVASTLSGRPQWRIPAESVAQFEQRRSSAPPPKLARRRRQTDEIDYFPD